MSRTSTTLRRLGVPSLAAATMIGGIPLFLGAAQAADPAVTQVTLTPATATAPSGNCVTYTASASTGATGSTAAAAGQALTIRLTEGGSASTPANSARFCDPSTGAVLNFSTGTSRTFATSTSGGSVSFGVLDTFDTATTGASNTTTVTAFADVNGNGVQDSSEPFDSSLQTVTAAATAESVQGILASPPAATNVLGEAHKVAVTLENVAATSTVTSQNVVSGVTPSFLVTGANARAAAACDGPTNSLGRTTCTYTGTVAGTDSIQVFVNQSRSGVVSTTGPDAGEPTTTVAKTYVAAQTGRTVTLARVDEPETGLGVSQPSSTNSAYNVSTDRTRAFTVTVDNADNTSTSATSTAGTLISFAVSGGSGDETVVASGNQSTGGAANQCTTVAGTGNTSTCTVTVNDPTPVSGQVLTVTATVRGTSTSGTGTLTYFSPVTAARNISIAGDAATALPGGVITYTASVVDVTGKPVPGVTVTFAESGAGAFRTSNVATTDVAGRATVELQAAPAEVGTARVTATIADAGTQCGNAAGTPTGTSSGNCSATVTSTFAAATTTPPAGGGTGAATGTVTIMVNTPTITAGSRGSITLTGPAGATVELQAYSRPNTTYATVRTGVLSADGTLTFDNLVPGGNTRLRARVTGGSFATSAVIQVRTKLSLAATRVGVRTYRFSGTTLPRLGQLVFIYRGNVLATTARATSSGTFSVTRTFTGTGTFSFTSRTSTNLNNVGGVSPARIVSIR